VFVAAEHGDGTEETDVGVRIRDRMAGGQRWLPPVGAWAAALALLCGAAVATGHDPWHAATWSRFDSLYYEAIARHGYEVHRCVAADGAPKWCGDAAWFPAYPLLLAAASAVGMPLVAAGVAISWALAAVTVVLVWRWFLPPRAGPLACAAFAPGLVYLYAVFPLSLLTASGVVFLRYLDRRRSVAGAAGAVTALAYPVGMAVVPIVAVVSAVQRRREEAPVARAAVLAGPAVVAGLLLVLVQRLQTGTWTAYADVAGSYGGLHDPETSATDLVHVLVHSSNPFAYALAPAWQFIVVTVLLALSVVAAIRRRTGAALVAWCVGVWFVPLLQTQQSLWRSEAGLVLLAPLLALLPRRLVWAAAAAFVVLAYGVAHEFFAGTLI
jgi:hypothetical protein